MGAYGRSVIPEVGSIVVNSQGLVMSFKILSVVGARPNFMKVAAICQAVTEMSSLEGAEPIHHVLVHTGQHYDSNMSDSFFNDLELPKPRSLSRGRLGLASPSDRQDYGTV